MKRIELYRACDGKDFATEKECLDYENATMSDEQKIEALIMTFTPDFSLQLKFARFFQENSDNIRKIFVAETKDDSEWISNEGNNVTGLPPSIKRDTLIEVQTRNGVFEQANAEKWFLCWKSTDNDPHDIVKYRIIHD